MANEYATLAELKAMRRRTDTDDDTSLQAALTRASRAIDTRTGRRFWLDTAASARTFTPRGRIAATEDGDLLLVDDIGSTVDLVAETGSGGSYSTLDADRYEFQPDNALARGEAITGLLLPGGHWATSALTRIRITARWGWPAVPDDITQAVLLLANRRYMRKDSPDGNVGSAEWGIARVSRWDPDVEDLVGPYILPGMA